MTKNKDTHKIIVCQKEHFNEMTEFLFLTALLSSKKFGTAESCAFPYFSAKLDC